MASPAIQIPSAEEATQAVMGQCDLYYLHVDNNRPQLQPLYAPEAKMLCQAGVKTGVQQIMSFFDSFPPTLTATHSKEVEVFGHSAWVTVKGQKFYHDIWISGMIELRHFTQFFLFFLIGGEWKIWKDILVIHD